MSNNLREITAAVLFVTAIIATRTVLHVGPNIEFVTAFSIAAGYYFSNRFYAFAVPLAGMILSDILLGNTSIFIFTWSGFLVAPLLGVFLKRLRIAQNLKLLIGAGTAGLISTMIFFLWTNFGVVITTSMYPKTLSGLLVSYINALPFLRNQLVSNLLIVPAVFLLTGIFLQLANRSIMLALKERTRG